MVDLNPLHYINKFNHMAGDNMASMMEFLGISDPAVDPDGIREIAKKWRALAKAVDASVKEAEHALKDVTWEGKTATAFSKRAKKTRTQATTMADSLRDGADALDKFADEAHELLTELNVIILEIIEVELAGLALSVLTGGASAVVGSLAAGARFAKAMAVIGRIEHAGTAMARTIRAVLEVIRGLSRALKALKDIKSIAKVGRMAGQGAKYSALDALLQDPSTFKDPKKLAETLALGAAMGVGLGGLGKLLGKGLGKLKPKDLAKLRGAMKFNCASFQRLSMRPGFDKLPASVRNALKKFVRDPIDVATGDMALTRADVQLPGVLPLLLERTHLSSYRFGGWFGPSWASTLDQRVQADDEGFVYAAADGARLCFPMPDPETGGPVTPETPGSRLSLTWDDEIDGAVRITDPDTGLLQVFHSPVPAADDEAVDLPLQYIQDRNGNRITIEYVEADIPAAVVHSGGYHIALDRDDDLSRIVGLRLLDPADPTGAGTTLITFGYDTDGHLTEETNSSGLPLRYTYDDVGRITSWTDRNETTYWYAYDDQGRVTATGGTGNALASTLIYDSITHTTRVTDSHGHTRTYEHNEGFRLIRETDPLGNVTDQEWDDEQQLLSVTDPLGHVTRYAYGENGRVTCVTLPDGTESSAEYNELGLPTLVVDLDGSRWVREYDEAGNLEAVTDPVGRTTRYSYDQAGGVTRFTDALGHLTLLQNDKAGLVVEVTDALGAVSAYERDAFGRHIVLTDALGARSRTEWTVEGRLSRRVEADGSEEVWLYDGEGNCTHRTDANGGVSHFEFSNFDVMSARTSADGVRHEFTYDTELRLTQVTNPQGLTWDYKYDPAGRLVEESDFDGRVQRYTHDAAGRLAERATPLGETIRYRRDAFGQVTRKDVAGRITEFSYDVSGRMLRAAAPSSILELLWDETGQLRSETVAGLELSYDYDGLGRRVRRTTPSGAVSTWSYDAVGNRTELTAAGRSLRFEHDAAGREIARHIGEHLTFAQTFDERGRPETQTVTGPQQRLIQGRTYRYRADGYVTGIEDDLRGGTTRFQLNKVGRVTGVRADGWRESYAYDSAGNQTDASWPAAHSDQTEQGQRDYTGTRILRSGSTRYEHDAAGRIVLRQRTRLSRKPDTWRYTWDAEDRLTSVITPDGAEWRYTYDPLGRRIAKERISDDGKTVAERVDFTWDGTTLCEQTTHDEALGGPVVLTWDHDGTRPLVQTERKCAGDADQEQIDERFYAIVTDLIGTPTELIDEDGSVAWHTRSALWGTTAWAAESVAYTPLRFPGQYFDPETGLHYNYFRYYDPATGRYHSPDPLGLSPADNPLTYPHNPCTWSDPLGLAPECGDPPPSEWVPDENYSIDAVDRRNEGNADRAAWFNTPQDAHDLVGRIVRNPNYPQRMTGPAHNQRPDFYQGGNSRAGQRWAGSPIYDNGNPTSQLRVVVDGDGNIAYFGRRKDGSHNYDQVIPYPWAKRP
ncbi:RHS repeat-associated core domain-containing protein [Streptomyces sp. Je 1-332]|uniref:RHS repeat-associated core domain-containing protein n=1 Tax=Streptomyces sp. Je 1-332 TaxID=3231270 RepID=UPI0034590698